MIKIALHGGPADRHYIERRHFANEIQVDLTLCIGYSPKLDARIPNIPITATYRFAWTDGNIYRYEFVAPEA